MGPSDSAGVHKNLIGEGGSGQFGSLVGQALRRLVAPHGPPFVPLGVHSIY